MPLLHQFDRKSPWLHEHCLVVVFWISYFKHSDEDEILPITVTNLLRIPTDTHYSIRAAVLKLLSQLGGWIKEHHDMLSMQSCLNQLFIQSWLKTHAGLLVSCSQTTFSVFICGGWEAFLFVVDGKPTHHK